MGSRLRGNDSSVLVAVDAVGGDDIGPQRLDVLRLQQSAPRRHLVLAAGDRVYEALALAVRELAQVEGALRVLHARAVAGGAVAFVNRGAALDLLRLGRLRGSRAADDDRYSGSSANVHTEPPGATLSLRFSRLM